MNGLKKMKPVDTLSLVDKVELRLLEFFKENNLGPGDSIPKELDFASSLGVSRTVIREALLRLRTLGLVESKKHRGMILKQPDIINNFERIMDPTLLGNDTLKNLFELRMILEMGMADFLFEHKTLLTPPPRNGPQYSAVQQLKLAGSLGRSFANLLF